MLATTRVARPHAGAGIPLRAIVGAVLGNALEFYDFTIYAFFAVMIGRAFFPAQDALGSLLLSVGTYGVGYVTRPLGGALIGAYADRRGRRAALTLTIALMALGTGMLALVPPYASIGIAAPCLVLLARLIQGLSAGGEMGPATTYLLEAAPAGKRGLYGAWQSASQGMASLLAGIVGYGLSASLSAEALQSWGWRAAFLVGLLIAPVGLYIRRHMPETLDPAAAAASTKAVLGQLLRHHRRALGLGILTISGAAVTVALVAYMTSYAIQVLKMPTSVAMLATLVGGCSSIVFGLLGGALSDRVGRRALMIWPRVLLVLAVYPAFLFLTEQRTTAALLGMTALIACLNALSGAVMLVQIPEAFPRAVRSTGLSVAYTLAVAIFGGTAQVIVTELIRRTGNPLSPAWYIIGTNVVCVVAMAFVTAARPDSTLD